METDWEAADQELLGRLEACEAVERLADALGVSQDKAKTLCRLTAKLMHVFAFNFGFRLGRFEAETYLTVLADWIEDKDDPPTREELERIFPGSLEALWAVSYTHLTLPTN